MLDAVRCVWASAHDARIRSYHADAAGCAAMSVLVQAMVRADATEVAFSMALVRQAEQAVTPLEGVYVSKSSLALTMRMSNSAAIACASGVGWFMPFASMESTSSPLAASSSHAR